MKIDFNKRSLRNVLVLILVAISLTPGCNKGDNQQDVIIPPEPVIPDAIYSLEPRKLDCVDTLLRYPNFMPGVPVSGNNKFELKLHVAKKGSWFLSTDTLNGMYYSGQGVFADTGATTISLSAYGKPLLPGSQHLRVTRDSVVRTISISIVDTTAVSPEPVPLKSYFRGKLGNDSIIIDGSESWIPSYNGPYDTYGGNGNVYSDEPNMRNQLSIAKARIYNYRGTTMADFKAFFRAGYYPVILATCFDLNKEGINLHYNAKTFEQWWSLGHLENQIGSWFLILGAEDGQNSIGEHVRVKARFSCRMRNPATGEFRILTGETVCYFYRPPS
ncbi:MAG: hypothetical protein EOO04_29635 [Chitinophagaceae bacterium]|nr:MAG: hypothetical protein EOO04_29635 [Chitinophagaceae bacterium]